MESRPTYPFGVAGRSRAPNVPQGDSVLWASVQGQLDSAAEPDEFELLLMPTPAVHAVMVSGEPGHGTTFPGQPIYGVNHDGVGQLGVSTQLLA